MAWGCVGVSFCFLAFRIYIRLRCFHRLFDDDIFVILAWFILLTTAILWGVNNTLDFIYVAYRASFGGVTPPSSFVDGFSDWLRVFFAITLLNICGLYCVKISVLLFFRRLGRRVKGQTKLWWSVSAVTVAGWAITFGVIYFRCSFGTLEYESGELTAVNRGPSTYISQRIATARQLGRRYAGCTVYKLEWTFRPTFLVSKTPLPELKCLI